METVPNIADAIRKMSDAYVETLSTMAKAFEGLPTQGTEAQRRLAEEWLRVARLSKDGVLTAMNQGFELWERECRRVLGVSTAETPRSAMEAWAENWKRTLDAFTAACKPGDAWSEQARRQAELVQQSFQEGLRAWRRLWEPSERSPEAPR